jgi:hypothetical protein
MESWMIQLIISLGGVIVTLGSVIGLLKGQMKPNNPNGCKALDRQFTEQVDKCNERFLEIAEERGEVKTSLATIATDVADIKKKLSRRR